MNEDITRRLRDAAEAHQPDRARMLARVERGAADGTVRHRTPSIARSWPKVTLAVLAITVTLATGGLAVAGIVRTPPPSDSATTPATPSPTSPSRPTPSAPTTPAAPAPTPTTTTAPVGPRPTPLPSSRVQNGPLSSDGSVDPHSTVYWAQSNLTLKTTQPLTSLTVELRIAQTGGVQNTGNWRTLPSEDFIVTVQEAGGALVYRWVLRPGRTVPTGQHEFAGQYNHATGVRNAKDDGYRVDTQTPGGSVAVWGRFTPAR
ncbi:hypothetical protein BX286_6355 [Streptomyces sp. 3211.6]|uniref:hypothetical protein n=1 Tax=Streptomyces sp. 3211.6 TaxID=1938845 RepID=UPI000EAD274F|nr:hypothetical protein [Streptomyces sp. 3211.6]RKT08267.1 hypothetical protein BX286_6355 [Streptomyces sp. 3211.6]